MNVIQIEVLDDNYAYLLIDCESSTAAAVDPADPNLVMQAAADAGVEVVMVLTTHHHHDHAGGNQQMVKKYNITTIVGGDDDRIDALSHRVKSGDQLNLGSINIVVYSVPCHTTNHVLYYATCVDEKALFTGDTLFLGGCGKFFEGTGDQMNFALNTVISGLPRETRLYCGHEYSYGNLLFAKSVEPNNGALLEKLKWVEDKTNNNLSSVPSTICEELTYNPFMRVHLEEVKKAVGEITDSDDVTMTKLRETKNSFRP
eukprot:TRINITY_DN11689_c0_g1_i1.p1 TRINITY_DN11689_c0_g1~~TRINITY_DN11689_c0_g1_i1.p1  ORF type:complete len:258 (-),score=61.20 TRINITY_DN11689_c0_g1_i1:66-839(-)